MRTAKIGPDLRLPFQSKGRTIRKLMGSGGRRTKKYSRKGK